MGVEYGPGCPVPLNSSCKLPPCCPDSRGATFPCARLLRGEVGSSCCGTGVPERLIRTVGICWNQTLERLWGCWGDLERTRWGERLLLGAWITLGARIGDTTGTGDMERLGNGEGDLPCVVGKRQICSELCMISLGETSHLLQHLDPNMFRVKLMMHGRFNLIFGDVNETILIVIPAGYRQSVVNTC